MLESNALHHLGNSLERMVTFREEDVIGIPFPYPPSGVTGGPQQDILDRELLDKIDSMIHENQTLLHKRRELSYGFAGTNRGKITARVLTAFSAFVWILDLSATIWEEVQGDNTNPAISFSIVPINFLAVTLSVISVWIWYKYGDRLHQAGKKSPKPDSEIEKLEQIRNLLLPIQQFLANKDQQPANTLENYLATIAREYEALPVDLQEKYPLDWIIAVLVKKLPKDNELRVLYERVEEGEAEIAAMHMSGSSIETEKLDSSTDTPLPLKNELGEDDTVQTPDFIHAKNRVAYESDAPLGWQLVAEKIDEGWFEEQTARKHALQRKLGGIPVERILPSRKENSNHLSPPFLYSSESGN